ncbi:hypothetical protein B4U79_05112 [Dinothrombium tinctorium]|uniref:Uncharacterized protein n=1 Tax=Dinothrombium tinctorium TaxID=1965070 RepID=A0A443QEF9_9ACAR|nr:hypothetical protein B4U79_05112 [Dinothrombium tinctorium]
MSQFRLHIIYQTQKARKLKNIKIWQ